jgi:hypothetical protein
MSFSKVVSTVAALASIFGASVAGYKLAEGSSDTPPSAFDQRIQELEKQLDEATKAKALAESTTPSPVKLPPATVIQAPAPVILPAPVQPKPEQQPQPNTVE